MEHDFPRFPLLKAEQIEVKVKQVLSGAAIVLLYKTARTDRDLLDQVVGPMRWQNTYRDIDGVLYCSVGIQDPETGAWVWKEDCGIESRADSEGNEKKGEASDAFKRACFKWGIGVELYSSPFIYIKVPTQTSPKGRLEIANKEDRAFSVSHIEYSGNSIVALKLVNSKGKEVYSYREKPSNATTVEAAPAESAAPKAAPAAKKAAPKAAPAKPSAEPVMTGSGSKEDPPFAAPAEGDEITQEMLTDIGMKFVAGMDISIKRKVTADIKKLNNGSVNYKSVPDPAARRELYNYFLNASSNIA